MYEDKLRRDSRQDIHVLFSFYMYWRETATPSNLKIEEESSLDCLIEIPILPKASPILRGVNSSMRSYDSISYRNRCYWSVGLSCYPLGTFPLCLGEDMIYQLLVEELRHVVYDRSKYFDLLTQFIQGAAGVIENLSWVNTTKQKSFHVSSPNGLFHIDAILQSQP